ncbi:hypothetical protein [Streptosporangium lutulentum]|uniref:Cellobiose-specific phosphotransferase system component IIB n=1 Tax=Streptosporangium lutulentum TaxID=1461250 RepID=A0ABT9QVP3_9ACTN|nr:hypothetical protein [Streptosporangium lutulentum]MDP9849999.1 cellobiose-specific phosphotransferase system component IIB [Streptosporangium lutulentum]
MTSSVADLRLHYRDHAGLVLLLMAAWGFGNLYEAVTVIPWLATLPPGSAAGQLEIGSPLFYFLPIAVCLLVLAWALVIRLVRGGADRVMPGSVRSAGTAAVLVTLAGVTTVMLVTTVNPAFHDTTATVDAVQTTLLIWEIGNALRMTLMASAAVCLLAWRIRLADVAAVQAGPSRVDGQGDR